MCNNIKEEDLIMSNAIEFAGFKLKKDVSVQEFMLISDEFQSKFLEGQKGYISRRLLRKDDRWADLVVWETEVDFENANKAAEKDEAAALYLSMLNLSAKGSFFHLFPVEKSY
jgi:hypothetical protein